MKTSFASLAIASMVFLPVSSAFAFQQTYRVSDGTGIVPIVQSAAQQKTDSAAKAPEAKAKSAGSVVQEKSTTPKPIPKTAAVDSNMNAAATQNAVEESSDSGSARFFNTGGWVQGGYSSQSTGLFNERPDRFEFNQVWLYAEREVNDEQFFGFRVDALYGTDASHTQAFGNPAGTWDFQNGLDHGAYGFAVPQAYVQVGTSDMNLKVGHFYTTIGYETVMAPDNFFYSHAITMFNSEPFTHTGMLGEFKGPDDGTFYAGWSFGWDTGFAQSNGGSSFLGGFSKDLSDDVSFTYMTTVGDFGLRGSGYSHSLVFDMKLTERLDYIVQSDLVSLDSSGNNNSEVGLNQYLIYEINDRWAAGTRMEWWKSDIAGATRSTYSLTSGLNFRPTENFRIRPEIRYNWGAPIVTGADMDTPIFAMDFVLQF